MDIIVDTISFRSNFDSYEKMIDFMGVECVDFLPSGKFNMNYNTSLIFNGIRIGCDGQAGWGYYIHMSGKGCRTYEDIRGSHFDWKYFICDLYGLIEEGRASITRLDLACDSFDDSLRLDRIEKFIIAHKYTTRCPDKSIRLVKFGEECLYVGSTQSLTLLRIYNKKLERGYEPGDQEIPYWYRCEIQLRDDHARQVVEEICYKNIGKVYAGHVIDHIRFITKPNEKNGCQSRIPTVRWWRDFLNGAEKISWISTKGSDYNMTKLERYAILNCRSSIATLVAVKNLKAEDLYRIYTDPGIRLRPDQLAFIEKHAKEIKTDE